MIFDTTFVIDILKGDSAAIAYLESLEKTSESRIVTAVTIHELWRGLGSINRKEQENILGILQALPVLPLDFESAKISGGIDRKLSDEGISIDPEDAMIAGIAIKHNQKLLTRNIKHFSRIRDLKVETY